MVKLSTGKGNQFEASMNLSQSDPNTMNPDYIYMDLSVINRDTDKSQFSETQPLCEFSQQSNTPMVDQPNLYKLAVRKFSLDGVTDYLPVFHFRTLPSSIDGGIYTITLQASPNNGSGSLYSHTERVQFVPDRKDMPTPTHPNDVNNDYYKCHSIQHVLDLFNTALKQAFSNVQNQFPSTNPSALGANREPFFWYDVAGNRIHLFTPLPFGDENNLTESWEMYVNQNTLSVMKDLPYFYFGTSGTEYLILCRGNRMQNVRNIAYEMSSGTAQSAYYYDIVQEFPSLGSYWSPIESIVVEAVSGINIVPTIQTTPVVYPTGSSFGNLGQTGRDHSQNIISEFTIDKSNPHAWNENLLFVANNFTFLTIANSDNQPLRKLKIQFNYRERLTSQLKPLYLTNQATAHLGLVLQKATVEER